LDLSTKTKTTALRTPLYDFHKSLGARLINFAGYEMPVQYEGIIQEHIIVRKSAGIFDVSHMGQLFIKHPENDFSKLSTIIPINFDKLKLHQSKYSFLLNDDGGIVDDLIVTRIDEGLKIILNAACKYNDLTLIKNHLGYSFDIKLDENLSLIAIQGPKAVSILEKFVKGVSKLLFMHGNKFIYNDKKIYVTRSGYTGEDGFEISIDNIYLKNLVEEFVKKEKVKLIGLGARDSLRLEAGLCLYGHDLNAATTPVEANLSWAIPKSLRKNGGFNGDKIILNEIKNNPKRIRVGIAPEGKVIAREAVKIFSKDNAEIGIVTSGTFGPSVDGPISMGYVDFNKSKVGEKLLLKIRDNLVPAKVTKLPFYKKNYAKN